VRNILISSSARFKRPAIFALTFALTLGLRIWDIDRHFWLLEDQIRDWRIALGPLTELPLVGPPTHVGGYTIGPAFYWILWLIRVLVGPGFQNLPHAGGIGQAILQSVADTILLAAVWRRTKSVWIGLTTIVLLATAALDLSLAALVWNPMAGSALAKIATAFVILKWPERSAVGVAVTAAFAWCAVQSYTGAIFVAVGVFTALLASPLLLRNWAGVRRNAGIIAIVVALLQVPYAIHQASSRFADSGMSAVTGSVGEILSGRQQPQFAKSWVGYDSAFNFILIFPGQAPWSVWVLVLCAAVIASRFRHDVALLSVTLLPQIAAIIGYAFYVGDFLDHYYYLSLMPAAVLTLTLSLTALRPPAVARAACIALLVGALAIVPARARTAATLVRMPEYGALVDGSRELVRQQRPMRAIQTEFSLPPTSDPQFIYQILGGRLDRSASWIGIIKSDGHVLYQEVGSL
jgi:hypothetical protein